MFNSPAQAIAAQEHLYDTLRAEWEDCDCHERCRELESKMCEAEARIAILREMD